MGKFQNELTGIGITTKPAKALAEFANITTVEQLESLVAKGDSVVLRVPGIGIFALALIKMRLAERAEEAQKPKKGTTTPNLGSDHPLLPPEGTSGRAVKGRLTLTEKDSLSGAVMRDEYRDVPVDDKWFGHSKPTANVGFGMSHTINKGNYESVRIDCSLHIPCYTHEVAKVQPLVRETVENWLGQAVVNAKKELGLAGDLDDQKHENSPDRPSGEGGDQKVAQAPPEAQESPKSGTLPWEGGGGPATESAEVGVFHEKTPAESPGSEQADFDLMKELGIDV